MRISDWSSDVCSSDLAPSEEDHLVTEAVHELVAPREVRRAEQREPALARQPVEAVVADHGADAVEHPGSDQRAEGGEEPGCHHVHVTLGGAEPREGQDHLGGDRSEEHTSELQSLMRISYAASCLKK